MATKIRLELFPSEQDAKVHAAMMKAKGYQDPVIERVEAILWDATGVTNGSSEEPTDFDNEMWLVTSRK
jgi:hypothetical protein